MPPRRYLPLADYLAEHLGSYCEVPFATVAALLGQASLPPSAFRSTRWWHNDRAHPQARDGWLAAGWRVADAAVAHDQDVVAALDGVHRLGAQRGQLGFNALVAPGQRIGDVQRVALELALRVLESALVLLDLGLDELRRRDHGAQLVGELRCGGGDIVGLDRDRRMDRPHAVLTRAQELHRPLVADDDGTLRRAELDRGEPIARQQREDVGLPFVVGTAKGLDAGSVRGIFSQPAEPPGVAGQWKQLRLRFLDGLGRNDLVAFAADRDEADAVGPAGAVAGGSADLLGGGVLLPSGEILPDGARFYGAFEDGTKFSGRMRNEIGTGYSPLDGYGFINAERAVNAVLKDD